MTLNNPCTRSGARRNSLGCFAGNAWHGAFPRGSFPTSTPLLSCLVIRLIIFPSLRPQFSKIGKVMRHINVLADEKVPRDDEFKFRERAKVLVDKWHDILKTNGASDPAKPATNGSRKVTETEDAGVNTSSKTEDSAEKENGTITQADADVVMKEETSANGVADESMIGDITMSEAT